MKKTVAFLLLMALTVVFYGCSGGQTPGTDISVQESITSPSNSNEAKPVGESELPSELYFLNAMDVYKDRDGNYYFDGYIIQGSLSKYGNGMTVTIKGKNGRELSSGNQSIIKHSFKSVNGSSYNIGQALLNKSLSILFWKTVIKFSIHNSKTERNSL